MNDSSVKFETIPLLSPVMESEFLRETWPVSNNCQSKVIATPTSAFWEENFQDLSGYCVDPQSVNWFQARAPFQPKHDYPIGEQITSKISIVGDNNDYLSNIKSRLGEITEISDNNRTADNNIKSARMSFEGSLPLGQDQFNTEIDTNDDWLSLLTTTNINEQQTIDNLESMPKCNRCVPDLNLDLICDNIETSIPNTTDTNTIIFDNSITNNQWDDNCMITNSYQSTLNNSTDEKFDQKCVPTEEHLLADILLPTDSEINSFDLLSYIGEESLNTLENDNIKEEKKFNPSEIIVPPETVNTNESKTNRKRKLSKIETTKIESYVPPLKINIRTKTVSPKKNRSFKLLSEESNSYADSDSDTPTSDYNYKELREKNNEASRKSRINKKVKETEMMKREKELERENSILKMKVEGLEKLVTSMRQAVLQSALKKES